MIRATGGENSSNEHTTKLFAEGLDVCGRVIDDISHALESGLVTAPRRAGSNCGGSRSNSSGSNKASGHEKKGRDE